MDLHTGTILALLCCCRITAQSEESDFRGVPIEYMSLSKVYKNYS
jgi:hypothetical protein